MTTSLNGKVFTSANTALLDKSRVPTLVGKEAKERASYLYRILTQSTIPLYLIGDSGTGKTMTMLTLLKAYSDKYQVPAFYFQLAPEDTKTSVFMGLRPMNGSMIPVDGIMAIAASENGIVGIDEVTHSTQSMLLMLNALDGVNSTIAIGDRSVDASGLKVIYGSNMSNVGGNIRIPATWANRVLGIPFGYPNFEDEVEISKAAAKSKFKGLLTVPDSVYKFIASFAIATRTSDWPLSSRNISHAIVMCELERKRNATMDSYFSKGNQDALRKIITERILGKAIDDVAIMQNPEILDFLKYVSSIGVERFREIIKIAFNFYVDLDGTELTGTSQRQKMISGII